MLMHPTTTSRHIQSHMHPIIIGQHSWDCNLRPLTYQENGRTQGHSILVEKATCYHIILILIISLVNITKYVMTCTSDFK